MLIWCRDRLVPERHVWSYDTERRSWRRWTWRIDSSEADEMPTAGCVVGEDPDRIVAVIEVESRRILFVGTVEFDLSRGGVFTHRCWGILSEFRAEQEGRSVRVWRLEFSELHLREPWYIGKPWGRGFPSP